MLSRYISTCSRDMLPRYICIRDMLPRFISSRDMLPSYICSADPCSKRATYLFENDSGGQKFN